MKFFSKKTKSLEHFSIVYKDFVGFREKTQQEDFTPWFFLDDHEMNTKMNGLNNRYASGYIPFAQRQDNDDIACWIPPYDGKVYIIHGYASPGWELTKEKYSDFNTWLQIIRQEHTEWVNNNWI